MLGLNRARNAGADLTCRGNCANGGRQSQHDKRNYYRNQACCPRWLSLAHTRLTVEDVRDCGQQLAQRAQSPMTTHRHRLICFDHVRIDIHAGIIGVFESIAKAVITFATTAASNRLRRTGTVRQMAQARTDRGCCPSRTAGERKKPSSVLIHPLERTAYDYPNSLPRRSQY